MADESPLYYLFGSYKGREIEIPLPLGSHDLGSSRSCKIRLRAEGVSRKHATIEVAESQVTIQDSGSTNGISVDGRKVKEATLEEGATVGLGPVVLSLAAALDMELAVSFEITATDSSRISATRDTTSSIPGFQERPTAIVGASETPENPRLDVLERCVRTLGSDSQSIEPALQEVCRLFGADGVALVEWIQSSSSMIGLYGKLGSVPDHQAIADSIANRQERVASWVLPESLVATVKKISQGHFGLLIWNPTRLKEDDLSTALPSLFELGLQRAAQPGGIPARLGTAPELRLPEGHKRGSSPAMVELYDQMRALLTGTLSVLISGETGVGKEGIARTLHLSSDRRDRPFIAVNCAAIPEDLLEAELFGVEKGAATGVSARPGCFREAEGGTIFLDEIGEMPMGLQAKLLRALQEREVRPLGGRSIRINVRILSATNIDLDAKMEDGSLRPDLFYRLAGFVLNVPPLRRRRTDIPGLIEFLLRKSVEDRGIYIKGLSVQAMRKLMAYDWPGNVRQLEHEVQGAAYRCQEGGIIQEAMLSPAVRAAEVDPAEDSGPGPTDPDAELRLAPHIEEVERRLIRRALERTQGNRKHAAQLLGISRNGLTMKLQRLGIEIQDDANE